MTLPYEIADLLQSIVLGSGPAITTPGSVVISGHDRDQDWDIQAAKGSTGATSKLNGQKIMQPVATFTLGGDGDEEVDDFERWDTVQRYLESTISGPTPIAVPIYHPELARQRITEVSVLSIGGLVYDGKGGATVVVKFIEYKPPKPKPVMKAQAKPASGVNGAGAAQNDPNAAAKAELAALVEQAKQP